MVKLDNVRSERSISGPILFNVFINDIFFLIVIVIFTTTPMITASLILVRQLIAFEISRQMTLLFLWTGLSKIL